MKTTKTEVKRRNQQQRGAGFSKAQVQRLAGVSERFVLFWYRGQRTSQKVQTAHDTLYAAAMTNGAARKSA